MISLFVNLIGDKEELQKLEHVFKILDVNKDGFLSKSELKNADKSLNGLGVSKNWQEFFN